MGTAERTAKPEDVQILALGLAYDMATLGFYPYTGDTLAANRVYLTLSTTSEYIWVNSVDENGKPAGYYAGEYNDGTLKSHLLIDNEEPYSWTLTGNNSNSITIKNSDNRILYAADDGTELLLNGNDKYRYWSIIESPDFGIRLRELP